MSKKAWTLLVIAVGIVAVLLGANASAQELQTVRLSEVVRSVFYAPQYVAIANGFFEEEGLKVDLSTAWGADNRRDKLAFGCIGKRGDPRLNNHLRWSNNNLLD